MTTLQENAINELLGIFKEGHINDDQFMNILKAIMANTPSIEYIPFSPPYTYPQVTYSTTSHE